MIEAATKLSMIVVMTTWLPRLRLEPARDEAPDRAERGRGQDGERQRQRVPGRLAGGERHEREPEAAEIGLPLAADVEQPGMVGHGDGEAR